MKHFLLKTWLILVCLLIGAGTMWAETYTGTVSSSSGTVTNSFTLNNVTWNIETTSGAGSPTITYGNAYNQKCIKFGSGASNSFGSVSLSTDYFKNNNKKVTKVEINALGSAKKNVTFSVGTANNTQEVAANAWTKLTLDNLNVTGALQLDFTLNSAGFFINQIVVTYEDNGGSTTSQYSYTLETIGQGSVTFNDGSGNTVAPNQKVNSGTKLTPTFTPADGYEFTSWEYYTSTGSWSNVSGSDFTITKDVKFRVTFSETQGGGGDSGDGGDEKTFGTDWNSVFGTSYTGSFSTKANELSLSGTVGGVTLNVINGSSTNGYVNTSDFRAYNGYKLTFTAPAGYNITGIISTKGGKTFTSGISADEGSLSISNNTINWTGSSSSVILSCSGTVSFETITVTIKSNGPAEISNLIKTSSADLYVGDEIADLKTYLNLPDDYAGAVTFSSTSENVEIDGNYLLVTGAGEATVHVVAAATDKYLETEGDITLNISKKTPVIAWTDGTKASYTIFNGNDYEFSSYPTAYLTNDGPSTINYTINGDAIIIDGKPAWETAGTYTVTAQTAENDAYNASNVLTYTINVVDPAITMTPADGTVSAENPTVTFTGNGVKIDYLDESANGEEMEGTAMTLTARESQTYLVTITDDANNTFYKNFDVYFLQDAGLQFSASELRVLVGSEDFVEPSLSKATNADVTYSLVYEKSENVDKVATIDPETGKLTLKGFSTETQGSVTVKASTPATDEYTAGEATYELVVYRTVPEFTWSATSVTIDQDELDQLPTPVCDRNVTSLESSNTEVARIEDKQIVFVGYGTTTITGKTTATVDYAQAAASYTLTFAPRYSVIFNVNGEETELREETKGAGVTAPEVEDIADYTFAGWATAAVAEETTDAQTFATLVGDKYMPTESTTLYAVYKRVEVVEGGSADEGEFLIYADVIGTAHYMADKPTASGQKVNQITSTTTKASAKVFTITKKAESENEFAISYEEDGTTHYLNCVSEKSGNNTNYYLQSTSAAPYYFTRSNGTNGTYRLTSTFSGQVIAYRASTYNVFKMFKNTNPSAGNTEYFDLELEQISGGSTTYYTSAPVLEVASINVSQFQNTTLCLSRAYTMPEGLVGKTVSASEGSDGNYTLTLTKKYNEGDVVPAGEALVVQGEQGTYTALAATTTDAKTAYPENLLVAEYTAQDTKFLTSFDSENSANYYYYKLTTKGGENFGWYYGDEGGVPFLMSSKERAYLVIEKEVAQSIRAFRLEDLEGEGVITGIEGVEANANETIYNLQGQRINRLQQGVNIVNGRKVLR